MAFGVYLKIGYLKISWLTISFSVRYQLNFGVSTIFRHIMFYALGGSSSERCLRELLPLFDLFVLECGLAFRMHLEQIAFGRLPPVLCFSMFFHVYCISLSLSIFIYIHIYIYPSTIAFLSCYSHRKSCLFLRLCHEVDGKGYDSITWTVDEEVEYVGYPKMIIQDVGKNYTPMIWRTKLATHLAVQCFSLADLTSVFSWVKTRPYLLLVETYRNLCPRSHVLVWVTIQVVSSDDAAWNEIDPCIDHDRRLLF